MGTYLGQPQKATSITVADDGTPPQAGQINPALEACWDGVLYVDAKIDTQIPALALTVQQQMGIQAASNFLPADVSRVTATPDPWVNCIAASATRFVASMEQLELGVCQVAVSLDGQGWVVIDQFTTAPGPSPRAIGILDYPLGTVNDCYIVVGGAYPDSTDQPGKSIKVLRPGAAGFSAATTTALAANTNYGACVFAGSRCYLFGGCVDFTGGAKVAGHEARIVSAQASDNYLIWNTATNGLFPGGNELQTVDRWDVATLGTVVVGMPIDFFSKSTYVVVNATTNTVTTATFPAGAGRNAGLTVWRGKFWHTRHRDGTASNTLDVYSSTDGVTWTLETTLLAVAGRALVTVGDMLVAIARPSPILGGNITSPVGAFYTLDGDTWSSLPTSFYVDNLACHTACSTGSRAAFLTKAGVRWSQSRGNLRVSMGGIV